MTIDIFESALQRTADVAAMLGQVPLDMTLTMFHLEVVSNRAAAHHIKNEAARASAASRPISRQGLRLSVVGDISRHFGRIKRD
ncbi:hypothetical protein DID96_34360 [Burkholderia sp. Bp8963]|uniref:hypothetical protein n=1 Tax=Burkholderia sp. Bp8963 TaxID=2184547 RepID=UPI000F596F2F|nr:hypothetical protein [Burkholderia sp. Bp8963]RQS60681.1 hypothetical protein DID96_34360 [Burkholderia sp. Bp8963]